jgi:CDP-diacylglycerol--serine O-phosphatidyltransferase
MQINLRKAMFVLPNLFTVSSIFLGFYSMTLAAGDATPEQLYRAALAIFFAIFFDMFDGRVARMTRTQSDFGVQLDSLADVISFGAAPALLVYKWALAPMGFLGLFLSFSFAACGALRLARFNVLAARGDKASHRFFTGLPIPLAAGVVIGLATRASFVLLVYAGAYILLGLVESIFFRHTIERSSLPASVQREIDSDEALEPDDDDLEAKDEGDEYI